MATKVAAGASRPEIAAAAARLEARGEEEARATPTSRRAPTCGRSSRSRPAAARARERRRPPCAGRSGRAGSDRAPRVTQSQTSTAARSDEARGGQQRAAPRQIGEAADEVRSGRAHGERAHQDADREPATRAKPRGHDLHRGRIGAGHAERRWRSAARGRGPGSRPRARSAALSAAPASALHIMRMRGETISGDCRAPSPACPG